MRVLGLSSYPVEAAATRFRLAQFVEPLSELGIELDIRPFLNRDQFTNMYAPGRSVEKMLGVVPAAFRRMSLIGSVRNYDLLLVQREAMFFGPAVFEWLYRAVGRMPMVLDLDDATYVRYVSPSYGQLASRLKFFGKTDNLIRSSTVVSCGNRYIADHVESLGTKAVVIPTVVPTDVFRPSEKQNAVPVVGWIGTHSTFPFLKWLFPVLESLAKKHRFQLRIVGAGVNDMSLAGIEVVNLPWELDREVEDFQSIDIGLYPMTLSASASHDWLMGKSGFKGIQYMAVGVPFVMSPIGVTAELGEPGTTHFNATTHEDWYTHLDKLLSDEDLRSRMGKAGRQYSLNKFTVGRQAEILANTLRGAARKL